VEQQAAGHTRAPPPALQAQLPPWATCVVASHSSAGRTPTSPAKVRPAGGAGGWLEPELDSQGQGQSQSQSQGQSHSLS